jgi:hypothetical protein
MELTDRWAVLYYEWSLDQADEEFLREFPLLSLVHGRSTFQLIEHARSLSTPERRRLAVALVKRFNERAMSLKGEVLNAEEQRLINGYLDHNIRLTEAGKRRLLPFASDGERRISELLHSGTAQKGKPSLVRKAVSKQLKQDLGSPTSKPSGTQGYVMEIPGWRLRTTIDYGGSHGQITYAHTITPLEEIRRPLQPPIHLCGCMGVSGQTSWDLYTLDDTDQVANSICTVISWFAEQWRALAASLGDRPEG